MLRPYSSVAAVALLLAASAFAASEGRIEKGNLVIEGIPDIPPEVSQRYQQYENIRSASLRDWHPSGQGILISTRFGETNQIHWVSSPGGARHQLTFFDEPVGEMEVVPGSNRFVFSKDAGGSEFYQIFLFDMEDSSYRMITDGQSRNGAISVSNRGDRIAYFTTSRNSRDWDIHIAKLAGDAAPRPVLEKGGFWVAGDWSPDDSRILLVKLISAADRQPFFLHLDSGELTRIQPTDSQVAYGAAVWSRDGTGIYFTSDEGSEFLQLKYYDVDSGDIEILTSDIPWDVGQIELSADGKWLAFIVNAGGFDEFHLWKAATREEVEVSRLPDGQLYGLDFSADSKKLAMVVNTMQTPGDVYVLDLETLTPERWTYSEVGGLDTSQFITAELIHYNTFDQIDGKPRQIPAFYYRPEGSGPFPVLVNIHGGPEAQHRPFFSSRLQYIVNELGIAVLAPNVRGSTGYGKAYLKLDNGYQREDSVKDIGKLLDWIETKPELDSSRVAVSGGSYGGYMVLAAMTHYSDRLRGGINIVGISNFVTFLENTESYRQDLRRVEYGDERDPDMRAFLERISPLNSAEKITKPLFIAQGLNDPRVPASEAEQILEAVRKNGTEPWYLLAKDEGHGFSKKSNRNYYEHASSLFLEKILLDRMPAQESTASSP